MLHPVARPVRRPRHRRAIEPLRAVVGSVVSLALVTLGVANAQADDLDEGQPNVIVVLVDDMSANLLPYMSEVQALAADGVTFQNYLNATPWCCPSRATAQSGKYPHNTQVRSNGGLTGGFEQFFKHDMDASIGVQMDNAGYRTGLMGKYLNGYKVGGGRSADGLMEYPANFVPPGWDDWFSGSAYQHFGYKMVSRVDGGTPGPFLAKGRAESTYYTDVMSTRADAFLRTPSEDPFFLMLAPFAPHRGGAEDPERMAFPAAPRDRADTPKRPRAWGEPEFAGGDCGVVLCADVPWPDTTTPGNFNLVQDDPLPWMAKQPISAKQLASGRKLHVQRIQMVQSVNDMLRDVRVALEETGQADQTWIMFTSDNGYHIGEHALFGGKTTAYDHDIKTPLIARPPGGLGGVPMTVSALVQNTDLLPTVVSLAGATVPDDVDGRSLLPLIEDPLVPWRNAGLLELTNTGDADGDGDGYFNPDTIGFEGDHVAPTYNALRTAEYLYIDYSRLDEVVPGYHEAEFYDLATDPDEMINLFPTMDQTLLAELNAELLRQTVCSGAGCWEEQQVVPLLNPVPPTSEPPTTEPPTTEPPTEPPTTEPPTEPPTTESPTEPPTTEPTSEPPTTPPSSQPRSESLGTEPRSGGGRRR